MVVFNKVIDGTEGGCAITNTSLLGLNLADSSVIFELYATLNMLNSIEEQCDGIELSILLIKGDGEQHLQVDMDDMYGPSLFPKDQHIDLQELVTELDPAAYINKCLGQVIARDAKLTIVHRLHDDHPSEFSIPREYDLGFFIDSGKFKSQAYVQAKDFEDYLIRV